MSSQAKLKTAMSANSSPSQALLNSAMSANSMPALPTELITHIFKSTNKFATATALSSTCHRFRSIWETDCPSICHAILVRTIPCYDQAFEYVRFQPLDAAGSEEIRDTDLLANKVTKQFYENADVASLALQYYEADVIEYGVPDRAPPPSSFSEAQRTCFLKAWYRVHILASLASNRLPYDMLAALDLLEFEQMMEALRWLMFFCPDEHKSELRISYHDGWQEGRLWFRRLPKSPISARHWYDLMMNLDSLSEDLGECPLDNRSGKRGRWTWEFMFHESYLDIKESGKGVRLADMLPLIEERDISEQRYKLSSWDQIQ